MTWNPNFDDDCAVGLEWFPERQVDRSVAGFGEQSYSWSVDSSASESVDRLWTFSSENVSNAYDTIDVYDADDLEPLVVDVKRRLYSQDASYGQVNRTGAARVEFSVGEFRTENVNEIRMGAGFLNRKFYTLINNEPMNLGAYRGTTITGLTENAFTNSVQISDREFIGLTAAPQSLSEDNLFANAFLYNSKSSQWSFWVDALGNIPAGNRVISLTVSAYCQRLIDPIKIGSAGDQPYRVRPAIVMGSPDGTRKAYLGQYSIMPDEPGFVSYTWYRNPVTALPWTTTDLANFNQTNQVHAVSWLMSRPSEREVVESTAGAIFLADATVRSVPDTRVAVARRFQPRQWAGWNRWDVTNPSGGSWSKAANKTYLFNASFYEQQSVDRRPRVQARGLSVRALGAGVGPQNGVYERFPDFTADLPRNLGGKNDFAPAVLLQKTNDVLSDDSQPYAVTQDVAGLGVISSGLGPFVVQLMTFDADDLLPDRIRFLVRSENDNIPSAPLQIEVQANSTVEATAVLEPEALVYPSKWQVVELVLEESLAGWESGVEEHVVAFTASGEVGWHIQVLSTGEANTQFRKPEEAFAYDASFDGADSYAVGEKAFRARVDADVCVTLGVAPAVPVGFRVEDSYDGCTSVAVLSWASYDDTPCEQFGGIEIQRQGLSGGWETIFFVKTPDVVTSVEDHEVRRNSTNVYRCRFVSATGFSSDWSNAVSVNLVDQCCGYTFSSNHAPDLSVWYDDIGSREYEFTEKVTYYEFENKDGFTAARGLNDLLDKFDVGLLVAAKGAHGGTVNSDSNLATLGRRLFDPLTVLAGNKRDKQTNALVRVPYVCVADNLGNRWFAQVETPTGAVIAEAGRYTLNVSVREITPTAVTAHIDSSGEPVSPPDVLPPIPLPEEESS